MSGDLIDPAAGKLLRPAQLIDPAKLIYAYYAGVPDLSVATQRIHFGTSGHRGSAFHNAFNEAHIIAVAEAVCLHRKREGIDGPLFLGVDTHALSRPAFATALEVFVANDVETMIDADEGFTPTPVISHAILTYNRGRTAGLADGVVLTPSHNPPEDGGFKYNPPTGGPAGSDVTSWIEATANELLKAGIQNVRRVPYARARQSVHVHSHDYMDHYIGDLAGVIDMEVIAGSGLALGIDPLGGASVHYWPKIIDRYGLNGTVVEDMVDPTFGFMTADWDGKIRMDCSSPYAMTRLIGMRDRFDLAFGNDTDADRHGIVTRTGGLMTPNHFLAASIAYLIDHRPQWTPRCGIGKTMVSSSVIDRIAHRAGRPLVEVPVGFKWFVDGLYSGTLGFAGEESAGASLLRRDGLVWTTDKDGLALGLLAAEITARSGSDPNQAYDALTQEFGQFWYERIDAPAAPEQMDVLRRATADRISATELAGEPIEAKLTAAPAGGEPFGGIKIITAGGWFAARPSGTEPIYKLYAESFRSADHLRAIQRDAQTIVEGVFARGEAAGDHAH
ncbi:phosphoglucomutase (alpha-D-glucose-1,6-bisphosphate-dependent) (plasmid) [Sphingobium sp. SJ10-10]|uniref:Phosphoglucomutase n=1 Tax=Sphingomonas sp. NS2 TaxID=908605 RepID=A0A0D4ZZ88_9SPHN|nr:phosphoglucomutase (alpha-D-glucose-1,6-bisphosphate-dependent) [Sphingobium sp. SJ10-10]AJW29263.1 Phosphoglucomutase [Sphingomonas sp. NS2]MEC6699473.1 phosphoglucomutase (alpha-D-glucose-1,6-bisphosphate-dependent) [Sphingobium sp. SJ10-10]